MTGSQFLLGLSLILFVIGAELLVSAYFPEASLTKLIPGAEKVMDMVTGSSSPNVIAEGSEYEGLNEPKEPLLQDAQRGFGPPGETLEFETFSAVLSFEPEQPIAGEATQVTWTFTDKAGNPVHEWDRSVHRTINHSYLIRSDFMSKSFHVHPGVKEDGTMTESIRFPTAGEWVISSQMGKDATTYLLTSVFTVYNADGTTETRGDHHTAEEREVTGARGISFERTLPLRNWDVTMHIEEGEPVRAGEPFTVEWIAEPRGDTNTPDLKGGILDGGHNILMANIDDPSLIWNSHGDRSQEPVSHLVGIPTYRWPTRDNPFKYTIALPKPGIWWIHFEIQSSPVHFFIDVAENPDAPAEALPIDAATVQAENEGGFLKNIFRSLGE